MKSVMIFLGFVLVGGSIGSLFVGDRMTYVVVLASLGLVCFALGYMIEQAITPRKYSPPKVRITEIPISWVGDCTQGCHKNCSDRVRRTIMHFYWPNIKE